jgi:hypothetical protein
MAIHAQQLNGEGSRTDKRELQLTHPAQAAYLVEQYLQGKTLAAQHQVIKPTIRSASHDFKDLL